ncbi:MAG: squalene/phytoene synthase family protein [Alphaproteobacteria bacterium]|nr:squalene/phytoene synthase family protein [Alphaproteobacteria bacterium]
MHSLGDFVRHSQPSLFWCTRGVARANREAIYTVFAFCRHIDSVLRSATSSEEKVELLNAWREEIDNIYDKKVPATNIGRKIYKNSIRFDLPKIMWLQILDSAFLDAKKPIVAPDTAIFQQYLTGMAIVPMHLALMILTPEHPRANQELAKNLGYAVFVTYILRDIKSDAKRGRIYIPSEILQNNNVNIDTAQDVLEDKNLIYARAQLAKSAEKCYIKAERLLSKMNKTSTRPLRLIMNVTHSVFAEMNARGWEIIAPKPRLSLRRRIGILYKTLFR